MCGRLACTLCPDDIVDAVHKETNKKNDENAKTDKPQWIERQYIYKPTYNGAPTTVLPVMVHKTTLNVPVGEEMVEDKGNYCIIPMRWGMILPNKPEAASATFHTHNARLENVLNSHLYKPCLLTGKRCVILADGYYEWQTTQGENHKQPYYMYQTPNPGKETEETHLIKFAGLFNTLMDDSGPKHTCSMLTKEADSSLTWMHHRMPIILNTADDIDNWLNSKSIKHDEALKMLPDYSKVASEYKLQYHQVDKTYVNKSACNSEKCMQRMTVKRKRNTLDSWLIKKA